MASLLGLNKPQWDQWIEDAYKNEPNVLRKNTYETELWVGLSLFGRRLLVTFIILLINANIVYMIKQLPTEKCGKFLLDLWFPSDCNRAPYGDEKNISVGKYKLNANPCFAGLNLEEYNTFMEMLWQDEYPDGTTYLTGVDSTMDIEPKTEAERQKQNKRVEDKRAKNDAYIKGCAENYKDKKLYKLLYECCWTRWPYTWFWSPNPGMEPSAKMQSWWQRLLSWYVSSLALTNISLNDDIKDLLSNEYILMLPDWFILIFGFSIYIFIVGSTGFYTALMLMINLWYQMSKYQGESSEFSNTWTDWFWWWLQVICLSWIVLSLNLGVVSWNSATIPLKFLFLPLIFNGFKTYKVLLNSPGFISIIVGIVFLTALWETPLDLSYSKYAKNIPTGIFIVFCCIQVITYFTKNTEKVATSMVSSLSRPKTKKRTSKIIGIMRQTSNKRAAESPLEAD